MMDMLYLNEMSLNPVAMAWKHGPKMGSKGKMARWARARNHAKRSFCPSWRIRCVCSLWATSTWICFRWGQLEVRMTRWFSHQFGGVEELKIVIFQQSWKYRILIDAVLYKKSRVTPQLWWTWGWMILILSKLSNIKNVQQKMFSCLLAFFPPHKSIQKKKIPPEKYYFTLQKKPVG